VGAVSVADDGTWLIAGAKSLFARLPGGGTRLLAAIIPEKDARRTNDGKADPAGRFVVGTLSLNGDSRTESLVRLEPDGSLTTLDDDLTLSNGMAWTADGRTMYSIDTLRRIIYTRPYDPVTGLVGKRDVLVQCEAGFPDGMCLDEEEHLWVAMWGLGQVHRFTPKGERVAVIDVPAPHVSSVAFAGPDLATLVITTATQDLDPDQLSAYPLSGQLFTASPGVRGLPVPLWSGVTPPVESRTS
jgi:sugar lactone lactonase YvrE